MNGSKISKKEYDRRVASLHEQSSLSKREIEKQELDIIIDYRLGVLFPTRRREELLQAKKCSSGFMNIYYILFDKEYVTNKLKSEYQKVLTTREMEEFFEER